tara:strand:+ start:326 stop:685 length:360 start_codon:yes stop_codon:yes gene_type:complete
MATAKKLELAQVTSLKNIKGLTPEMLKSITDTIGVKEVKKVAGGKGKQVLHHLNSMSEMTESQKELRNALDSMFKAKKVINSSKDLIEISNHLFELEKGISFNDNWSDLAKKGKKKEKK